MDRLAEELALEKAQWKKRTVREQEQNAARDMQRHGELTIKVRSSPLLLPGAHG